MDKTFNDYKHLEIENNNYNNITLFNCDDININNINCNYIFIYNCLNCDILNSNINSIICNNDCNINTHNSICTINKYKLINSTKKNINTFSFIF